MRTRQISVDGAGKPGRLSVGSNTWGWLLCLLYVAVFSTLSILKHHNIHSHAFDLAVFQQVVWSTAHGDWFRYTCETGLGPGATTNYLGNHFELILLPISFLYLFCDRPEVLLLLQTFSLATAGFLIFVIVKRWSGSAVTASLFQILFYVQPAVQGPNLFDFHSLVLAPAFLLLGLLGVETGRFRWLVAGSLLAVLCREQVAISVAALGAYAFLRTRQPRMLLLTGFSLAWLALTVGVLIPMFHPDGVSLHFAAKFGYLGNTPAAALRTLVLSPRTLLQVFGDPDRIRYLKDMFLCSGVFLPLFSPGLLLVALSEMGVNVLSQVPTQRVMTYQYSATAAAFLVLASARGAVWIVKRIGSARWRDNGPRARLLSACMGIAAISIALFFHFSRYGAIYPLGRDPLAHDLRGVYRSSERTKVAYRFMSRIPDGESVSAQSDLAPHLSNRREIYVFPVVKDAKYVLIDQQGETFPAQLLGVPYSEQVRRLRDDPRYEVILEESGYVLFRKRTSPEGGGYSK
jgi:uncharacterized membrane protein